MGTHATSGAHTALRCRHHAAVFLCLAASLAAAAARAEEEEAAAAAAPSLHDRALALQRDTASRGEMAPATVSIDVSPLLGVPPASRSALRSGGASGRLVDYRAWFGSGRASLGIGLTTAAFDEAPMRLGEVAALNRGADGAMLGVGLRYRLTTESQLTFDSLATSRANDYAPQMRVGMEFKSAPSQALGIARGTLMRVQLSGSSNVSLNWRGGKVGLMLRSQF